MKYFFYLIILFCVIPNHVFGKIKPFEKTENCQMGYIAFDIRHMECLNKTIAVRSIEKNFQESLDSKICSDCAGLFPNASKFVHLYKKKYMVLGVQQNDFGGDVVFIVVENEPYLFQLWLYPIEDDFYQLRTIFVENLSKKTTAQMLKYSKESQYSKYWHQVKK